MALSILDGNQSATTLSTILSSGQHITAHTVVSLGTQAITDMRSAVSGSVVSISNLPATQPVSIASVTIGNTVSVTGGLTDAQLRALPVTVYPTQPPSSSSRLQVDISDASGNAGYGTTGTPLKTSGSVTIGAGTAQIGSVTASISGTVPVSISSVTVGNTVTIAGTVTANPTGTQTIAGTVTANLADVTDPWEDNGTVGRTVAIKIYDSGGIPNGQLGAAPVVVGGTVTIGSLPAISGTVTANTFALQGTAVTTSNFTSTTASTVLAGYNATREVLTIFNEGPGNLHVCAGASCTTIGYQVRLSAGDYYEVPNHQTTITHSAVFATAGTARVTQVS